MAGNQAPHQVLGVSQNASKEVSAHMQLSGLLCEAFGQAFGQDAPSLSAATWHLEMSVLQCTRTRKAEAQFLMYVMLT